MKQTIRLLTDLTKLHNNSEFINSKYGEERNSLLKELSAIQNVEKNVVEQTIEAIRDKLENSDYFLTKTEFENVCNTKNIAGKIKAEFAQQITQMHQILKSYFELLSKQELTTDIEEKYLNQLNKLAATLDMEEETLKKYFDDVKKLKYDRRVMSGIGFFSWIANKTYFRGTIAGLENVPRFGPCIIAPRHYHASGDPLILNSAINRKLFYATSVETFLTWKKFLGEWGNDFFYNTGCVPIKRDDSQFTARLKNAFSAEEVKAYDSSNKDSARKLLTYLKHGEAVVIFPEAEAKIIPTYTNNALFLKPQDGFVRTAVLAQELFGIVVPIIPVGFVYENKAVGWNAKVTIGKPIIIPTVSKVNRETTIATYTESVFEQIKILSQ